MTSTGKRISELEGENERLRDQNKRMREALEPFAAIGCLLFARPIADITPVVEIGLINGRTALTRGHFKAAHLASCDDEERKAIAEHYRHVMPF